MNGKKAKEIRGSARLATSNHNNKFDEYYTPTILSGRRLLRGPTLKYKEGTYRWFLKKIKRMMRMDHDLKSPVEAVDRICNSSSI
jgi:hypothetical protein